VPSSLFAADFQAVLNQAVNPPTPAAAPFPSPEDWRDRWIYFLMLDRFNSPNAAPNHIPFRPALRTLLFPPISGDGVTFAVSGFTQGVVAFSRI
jgi:hypothetical protein